jgi:hypothetical protein
MRYIASYTRLLDRIQVVVGAEASTALYSRAYTASAAAALAMKGSAMRLEQ